MSITTISMFLASVALQLVMLTALPSTMGYTKLLPTLVAIAAINLAIFLFARLLAGGVNLSILIPLSAAVIPLGAIVIAIVVYKEPVSVLKIALLVGACGMIGAAASVRS